MLTLPNTTIGLADALRFTCWHLCAGSPRCGPACHQGYEWSEVEGSAAPVMPGFGGEMHGSLSSVHRTGTVAIRHEPDPRRDFWRTSGCAQRRWQVQIGRAHV